MIEPKVKIECDEDEEIYIIGSGGIHEEAAVHIVAIHNKSLQPVPDPNVKFPKFKQGE